MQIVKYQNSFIFVMSKKKNTFVFQGKHELNFLNFCRNYPEQVISSHESSVTEGFEYLFSLGRYKVSKRERMRQFSGEGKKSSFLRFMVKLMFKLRRWRKRSFHDLNPYFDEIKSSTFIHNITKTPPVNSSLWKELNEYAFNKWDIVKIGFTELPTQLIFKNKFVLFQFHRFKG